MTISNKYCTRGSTKCISHLY